MPSHPVVQTLRYMTKPLPQSLSDRAIRDELVTMLMAGHETTGRLWRGPPSGSSRCRRWEQRSRPSSNRYPARSNCDSGSIRKEDEEDAKICDRRDTETTEAILAADERRIEHAS